MLRLACPKCKGLGSVYQVNMEEVVPDASKSIKDGAIVPLGGGQFGLQFWNPASATVPAAGTFGTCGIGSFRGPGLATADLNLAKHFVLGERTNLEAMAQFINVTNTPILGRPSFFQGSTFGVISASNPGRQIQFGLKLHF